MIKATGYLVLLESSRWAALWQNPPEGLWERTWVVCSHSQTKRPSVSGLPLFAVSHPLFPILLLWGHFSDETSQVLLSGNPKLRKCILPPCWLSKRETESQTWSNCTSMQDYLATLKLDFLIFKVRIIWLNPSCSLRGGIHAREYHEVNISVSSSLILSDLTETKAGFLTRRQ